MFWGQGVESGIGDYNNKSEVNMKRLMILTVVLMLAATTTPSFAKGGKGGGGGGKGGASGTMSVEVRDAIVRTTPNYMGASAGTLHYGAEVNVTGEEGNWYKIASPSGWLPKSAVTSHKIAANPDAKGSGGSHDEVALAGKGFNPQVEAQYKRDNAALASAYAQVDRIEGFGASEGELRAFQSSGKLSPR